MAGRRAPGLAAGPKAKPNLHKGRRPALRHGLVAMAFLNSKERKEPNQRERGLVLETPSEAFVAHWPGGQQPLYGTNPMVALACTT